jgi:hypothetical protein
MKKCPHCNQAVSSNHYCSTYGGYVDSNDLLDFLSSAAIGYATDNALLGGLLGGDMLGGLVGDLFSDGDLF